MTTTTRLSIGDAVAHGQVTATTRLSIGDAGAYDI